MNTWTCASGCWLHTTHSTHIQCFKSFVHLSFFLKSKWNRSRNQNISDNQNWFWLRSKWKTKSFYDRCRMSNTEFVIIRIHSKNFQLNLMEILCSPSIDLDRIWNCCSTHIPCHFDHFNISIIRSAGSVARTECIFDMYFWSYGFDINSYKENVEVCYV